MATVTFEAIPQNNNARRRLMRQARLGTRPVPTSPDYGDAAQVLDTVRAYEDGWSTSSAPLSATVRTAWAARKGP